MADNDVDKIRENFNNFWKDLPEGTDIKLTPEELETLLTYMGRLEIMLESAVQHTWKKDSEVEEKLGILDKVEASVSRPWLWDMAMKDKKEKEGQEDGK